MVIFFVIGVVLVGLGVTVLLSALSRGGTAGAVGQIESYGFAAAPVTEYGPSNRPFGGVVANVGGFAKRSLGVGEHGIRRDLLSAGMYDTDPLTVIGYRVLAAAALAGFAVWVTASTGKSFFLVILGGLVLGLIGWTIPITLIKRRGRKRVSQIDYELPELIDLLVVTLEAGLSFLASLHMAAERLEGPLGVELRLTLHEQRMGLTVNDALEGMLARCETPSLRTFVRSIVQGELLGVSTGQIMRNLAIEMRKRRRAKAEERAQKAPIKMLFPLIFLIFPAMFIILLGPAYYSISKIFGSG